MKDEVNLFVADKHQRFLQIDTIILGVWPDMTKFTRITSLLFFAISEEKSEL